MSKSASSLPPVDEVDEPQRERAHVPAAAKDGGIAVAHGRDEVLLVRARHEEVEGLVEVEVVRSAQRERLSLLRLARDGNAHKRQQLLALDRARLDIRAADPLHDDDAEPVRFELLHSRRARHRRRRRGVRVSSRFGVSGFAHRNAPAHRRDLRLVRVEGVVRFHLFLQHDVVGDLARVAELVEEHVFAAVAVVVVARAAREREVRRAHVERRRRGARPRPAPARAPAPPRGLEPQVEPARARAAAGRWRCTRRRARRRRRARAFVVVVQLELHDLAGRARARSASTAAPAARRGRRAHASAKRISTYGSFERASSSAGQRARALDDEQQHADRLGLDALPAAARPPPSPARRRRRASRWG